MALPTIADCKAFLRVEHAEEDTLFSSLLAKAKADIQILLGYALTAVARTHVDYAETDNYGVQPQLALPGPFLTSGPAPVVTDKDGATVNASTYYLDDRGLRLLAKPGYTFCNRPYMITATIGLSAHPDYATTHEPIASQAIIDLVAHRYHHRDPAEKSSTDEGGSTLSLHEDAIPPRIVADLMKLPGSRGMLLA